MRGIDGAGREPPEQPTAGQEEVSLRAFPEPIEEHPVADQQSQEGERPEPIKKCKRDSRNKRVQDDLTVLIRTWHCFFTQSREALRFP